MMHILHDWDDVDATRILATVAEARAPHSRLLVIEEIVPPPGEPHDFAWLDLEMLVLLPGRERTLDEFRSLFATAGLRCDHVVETGMQPILGAVVI